MDELLDLCNEIKNCKKCDLQYSRKAPVCGYGNTRSPVMIIGEAPGSMEDDAGRPFVGRSGGILNVALDRAGMRMDDVYLTSSVRCRPKVGRMPKIAEIKTCADYLRDEISIINPSLVVPMGNSAIHAISSILNRKLGRVSEANDHVFHCGKYFIIPQYHPSAILRNPKKQEMFKDSFVRISGLLKDIEKEKMDYVFEKYSVQRI